MGQQQLLLIVLTTILVGVAVYTGVQLVNDFAKDDARNSLTTQIVDIYTRARAHSMKPVSFGGGGGSFTGFAWRNPTQTQAGAINCMMLGQNILIWGSGNEIGRDGRTKVQVAGYFDNRGTTLAFWVIN